MKFRYDPDFDAASEGLKKAHKAATLATVNQGDGTRFAYAVGLYAPAVDRLLACFEENDSEPKSDGEAPA